MIGTTTTTSGRVERALAPANSQWWLRRVDSMRLGNPVVLWVGHLLEEAAATTVNCPRCRCRGRVVPILDHALWYHGLSFSEAADWLEQADGDLFSLAVHYLTSKDRAAHAA